MRYTVQQGDTLYRIAKKFGTTVTCIMTLNHLTSTVIYVGQQLSVNENTFPYTVQQGDTLYLIAKKFSTTIDCIMELNHLTSTVIYVGQQLLINGVIPSPQPEIILIDVVPDRVDKNTYKDVNIYRVENTEAIFFISKMAIDADGSPRAYNPSDTGIDQLSNAGSPGKWWGIATINGREDGEPCIQGPYDPYPGYYVSTTSLADDRLDNCDYRKYVDSEKIPYIVLPLGWHSGWSIGLGDFSTVINLRNMKIAHAIFADLGPNDKIGEGSIALAQALGINSNPKTGGTDGDILYIVHPGSGAGGNRLRSLAEINQNGSILFKNWGGINQVYAVLEGMVF
jgi:LysM repeat protein